MPLRGAQLPAGQQVAVLATTCEAALTAPVTAGGGHSSCWIPGGGTAVTQCFRVVIHNHEGTVNRKTSAAAAAAAAESSKAAGSVATSDKGSGSKQSAAQPAVLKVSWSDADQQQQLHTHRRQQQQQQEGWR